MVFYRRKNPRLPNFDYSENGGYFLTICTRDRKQIFSEILPAAEGTAVYRLKPFGKIVDSVIQILPQRFPVAVENYVIMPNHIHLLILIQNPDRIRAIPESPLQSRSVISQIIGYLKMNVSKQIHQAGYSGLIWQRSFHDHIIRNQKDYDKIWNYIEDNPRRWEEDCFYCGMID